MLLCLLLLIVLLCTCVRTNRSLTTNHCCYCCCVASLRISYLFCPGCNNNFYIWPRLCIQKFSWLVRGWKAWTLGSFQPRTMDTLLSDGWLLIIVRLRHLAVLPCGTTRAIGVSSYFLFWKCWEFPWVASSRGIRTLFGARVRRTMRWCNEYFWQNRLRVWASNSVIAKKRGSRTGR